MKRSLDHLNTMTFRSLIDRFEYKGEEKNNEKRKLVCAEDVAQRYKH